MKIRLIQLFLLFLILVGCGSGSDDADILALIEENKVKWQSSEISNYIFSYSRTPSDCPTIDAFPPVVITVVNDAVYSVYVPAFGAFEASTENWPTISELFEIMKNDLTENPVLYARVPSELNSNSEFDDQYGYPIHYYFDKSDAECDAFSVTVSEFQ